MTVMFGEDESQDFTLFLTPNRIFEHDTSLGQRYNPERPSEKNPRQTIVFRSELDV